MQMQMKSESIKNLLMDELADLYDAEKQLVEALPKMAQAASDNTLKAAFENHLAQTTAQVERLDGVFQRLQGKPKSKSCAAMKGLIAEGEDIIKAGGDPNTIDAALIGAAQRVEHYEIAGYGCARAFAHLANLHDVARTLDTTLEEEKATDEKLSEVAEQIVNPQATSLKIGRPRASLAV